MSKLCSSYKSSYTNKRLFDFWISLVKMCIYYILWSRQWTCLSHCHQEHRARVVLSQEERARVRFSSLKAQEENLSECQPLLTQLLGWMIPALFLSPSVFRVVYNSVKHIPATQSYSKTETKKIFSFKHFIFDFICEHVLKGAAINVQVNQARKKLSKIIFCFLLYLNFTI